MTDQPLPQIPGYELQKELGVGGMATVYLARQTSLDRKVAIKVMRTNLREGDDGERTEKRFLREGRMLARLSHKNVCGIYDIAKVGNVAYIAMEYIEGGTLGDHLRRGMTAAEAIGVTVQLASALAAAHALGIVHRDLKPANVMMRGRVPVLTDFGIARDLSGDRTEITGDNILGTPHYMSPEQISGKPIDGRSDVYSLGAMLYELLTGTQPYQGDSPIAVCMQHLQAPIPQLPEHFADLQPVIDRMLAKDRDERLPDMASVVVALRTVLMENPALRQALRFDVGLPLSEQMRGLGFSYDGPDEDTLRELLKRTPRPQKPMVRDSGPPSRVQPAPLPPPDRRKAWIAGAAALLVLLAVGLWFAFGSRELSDKDRALLETLATVFDDRLAAGKLVRPPNESAAHALDLMQELSTSHKLVVERRQRLRAEVENQVKALVATDGQFGAARSLLAEAAPAFDEDELAQRLAQLDDAQRALTRDADVRQRGDALETLLASEGGLDSPELGARLAELAAIAGATDARYQALEQRVRKGLDARLQQALAASDLAAALAQRDRIAELFPDDPAARAAAVAADQLSVRLQAGRTRGTIEQLLRDGRFTPGTIVEVLAGLESLRYAGLDEAERVLREQLLDRTAREANSALQAMDLPLARSLLGPVLQRYPDSAALRILEGKVATAEQAALARERAAEEAARAGRLALDAVPWGKVLKVVGSDGREQPLGQDAATPLLLTLPEGEYTITVQGPDGRSQQTAKAQVARGKVSAAELRFAALDADAYLKQAGFR